MLQLAKRGDEPHTLPSSLCPHIGLKTQLLISLNCSCSSTTLCMPPVPKLLGTVISIAPPPPPPPHAWCSSWCLAGPSICLFYNCLVLTSRLFISEGHSLHFMSVWLLASCRTLPSSSINIKGKWSFLDFTWQVSKELFYAQSSKIRSQTPAK